MSMRHAMKARRALTAVAITTGLALAVAGCGGDSGKQPSNPPASSAPKPGKEPDQKPKGTEATSPTNDAVLAEIKGGKFDATIKINSAVRDAGGFLTVSGKVSGAGRFWNPNTWSGDERELKANGASMAGASLVDRAGKKKYLVLRDTDGRCLCTQFTGGFKAGEEKPFFAQFPAPPAGTTKVDFQIADMPPASIEISEGQ
ncbi:hypothetical protein ACIP93_06750 [Streptomyces sp. NPDC088745]|uniref:hypothetical protein n=1 Tax=Streptomyces sp. NPDC088745 TaxID=3365884 RepID=UPI00382BD265